MERLRPTIIKENQSETKCLRLKKTMLLYLKFYDKIKITYTVE